MDLQNMLNAMTNMAAQTRSQYHLTLGQLITELAQSAPDAEVTFDSGEPVGGCGSYRGYYSDLAFCKGDEPRSVASLLEEARTANGKTFEGYKGGDFTMSDDTPLWFAEYGCLGPAIIGVTHEEGSVILATKVLPD